ncbi:MAG: hypothetical protein ACXVYY_18725 [Oryzihumus sp.]
MFSLGVEQVRQMPIGAMAAMLDALTAGEVAAADEATVLASQMVINAMGAIQARSIASLAAREREHAATVVGRGPRA